MIKQACSHLVRHSEHYNTLTYIFQKSIDIPTEIKRVQVSVYTVLHEQLSFKGVVFELASTLTSQANFQTNSQKYL